MKKPVEIPLSAFTYDLPDVKIARFPLPERDQSRLLLYQKGSISETRFRELPELLSTGQMLVFNNTRVIHARIRFRKKSGAAIEIFCLEPLVPSDHQLSFAARESTQWRCLVGNARKWKHDEILTRELTFNGQKVIFNARKIEQEGQSFRIGFSWSPPDISFSEVLEASGETPIPPYLNREAVPGDAETYQTVYSAHEGSVAAPTAGLHFTERVLSRLDQKGIERVNITLHVGAGTFTPVKTENAAEHKMHIEKFHVSKDMIEKLSEGDKSVIATGTTSCRTLESLYWLGVKQLTTGSIREPVHLGQWEAWDLPGDIPAHEALQALSQRAGREDNGFLHASTGIMITPGYRFRMVDGLITNFHQPSSTLLMLIAAFIGDDWKKVYRYALENDFRFLSYGDSSFLLP
ncbi:MAG TPA: S-adenosylmethionine:tRNA ribosyltransferase-isomerase [Bacteroidales bacterium]|nr:S-adenosylmethionine:tRNA ribosyltransferase-isomerase [Bacteroidales bacterium]